jgi:hypothetical protein
MLDYKPKNTPMESKTKGLHDDIPYSDPSFYHSIVGALQYLTLTRPNLSFYVNYVSQFLQSPSLASMKMVRRILRYVKGSIHFGLHLTGDTTLDLCGFFDADWAGCPTTRRSTTGFCTFLGRNIISWCAKKQPTISRSSTEAEYRAMANTAAELTWLTFLLRDLRVPQSQPPILFCDNLSALHMTINPVFHARSKHIDWTTILFVKGSQWVFLLLAMFLLLYRLRISLLSPSVKLPYTTSTTNFAFSLGIV